MLEAIGSATVVHDRTPDIDQADWGEAYDAVYDTVRAFFAEVPQPLYLCYVDDEPDSGAIEWIEVSVETT